MRDTVIPVARSVMSPDFVREGTKLAIAEMLRAGITSFSDMYLFPEEAARVAAAARVHAAIGLPVTDGPTVWAESATGHLAKAEQLWDEYQGNPWVSLYFAPHNAFSPNDPTLGRVRRVADELDARVALYLAPGEVPNHTGHSPLLRLQELGLLGPGFTAVQLSVDDAEGLRIAAEAGVGIVGCQQSHLRLGGGLCPVVGLAARGMTVGLGTDSPLSVGALDMLAEIRATALLAGLAEPTEDVAAEVLRIATLGGAQVLGWGADLGSIEIGKSADLICIDLATLPCQAHSRPTDALVFAATRDQVTDVWTAGRTAIRAGHLLIFDEQELLALARSWAERIPAGENS
jgi:5-methylthioadenosine/S-adenosylhomocysteine deaminase